jgi:hypothetical protein
MFTQILVLQVYKRTTKNHNSELQTILKYNNETVYKKWSLFFDW